MPDCPPKVFLCFADQGPAFLAKNALVVWIDLWQQALKTVRIRHSFARVVSLIEPVKQLAVDTIYFVPGVGGSLPLRVFSLHRPVSVLLASVLAACVGRTAAICPNLPSASSDVPVLS